MNIFLIHDSFIEEVNFFRIHEYFLIQKPFEARDEDLFKIY